MGTVKIKINKQVVNKIEFAEYRALQATAKWLIKDIEKSQKVPFDTGKLQDSIEIRKGNVDSNGKITYEIAFCTPYARRLYYHPEYNFQKKHNQNAQAYWLEEYRRLSSTKNDEIKKVYIQYFKKYGGFK